MKHVDKRSGFKRWSNDEIAILKANYAHESRTLILELLPGRTWDTIRVKAHSLGFKRDKYKFPTGYNNPKFIDKRSSTVYYCQCGRERDRRANKCINCKSFNIPKETVEEAVLQSQSYKEVAHILNSDRQSVTRFIQKNNINIDHFKRARERLDKPKDVLCFSEKRRNQKVRKTILINDLLPYKCSICNLEPIWQNKELVLQLDHINGIPYDNRLENLRFLCPNCHTQTPTYNGGNAYGKRKK